MKQAKRAVTLIVLLMTAACGDLPVAPTHAAEGAARLFSAPSVTISGPGYLYANGWTHTWYAHASGGNGTYTYQWEERDQGGWFWTPVGSGSSYSRYIGIFQGSFELRVTVTSNGASASAEYPVCVETCDPWGCP